MLLPPCVMSLSVDICQFFPFLLLCCDFVAFCILCSIIIFFFYCKHLLSSCLCFSTSIYYIATQKQISGNASSNLEIHFHPFIRSIHTNNLLFISLVNSTNSSSLFTLASESLISVCIDNAGRNILNKCPLIYGILVGVC